MTIVERVSAWTVLNADGWPEQPSNGDVGLHPFRPSPGPFALSTAEASARLAVRLWLRA